MRLFVAITPPPEAIEELGSAVEQAVEDVRMHGHEAHQAHQDAAYRWSATTTWHVTLSFLGEVRDDLVPELERRLARAAARHAPMSLALDHAGAFSSARRARVLWMGVGGDLEQLRSLERSVSAAVRRAGVEGASGERQQRFRPHVTLARLREPADVRPMVESLGGFHGRAWTASTIALVRSRLGQGHGRTALHETIGTFPLGSVGGTR